MSQIATDFAFESQTRADASAAPAEMVENVSIFEMLLKDNARLNQLLRDEARQREFIPKLIGVAVTGFAIYGAVVTGILNGIRETSGFWPPALPESSWSDWSIGNLTIAYTLGLIAANGICLPSFYFYGLLAGIPVTMLSVTAHALKGMAAGAVALLGLLPIYVALALSVLILPPNDHWSGLWIAAGLALPFIAGLAGAANLYQGFVSLADTIRRTRGRSRECFLRRLMLAWVGCSLFVLPPVIYTLWDFLSDRL